MARRRLTSDEAGRALGISVDAVRKRAERGQLSYEREGGRLYILLDQEATEARPSVEGESEALRSELLAELRDRLRYVEGQLEAERQAHGEARRLLAAALERIPPQLEAPQEPPGGPETATPQPGRGEPQRPLEGAQEGVQRPWWRRMFGA